MKRISFVTDQSSNLSRVFLKSQKTQSESRWELSLPFITVWEINEILLLIFGFYPYTPMYVALYTQYFPESCAKITGILLGWDSNPRPSYYNNNSNNNNNNNNNLRVYILAILEQSLTN